MTALQVELFEKYDKPSPRYTSYPPIPYWKNNIAENTWFDQLREALADKSEVDLYIHLPYCEQLCFYCGCNRIITKDHSVETEYIDTILMEWMKYVDEIPGLKIKSIHLGGGTPTFMSPKNLSKLLSTLEKYFVKDDFVGAVEMDPRVTRIEHVEIFQKYGFKRGSLGIQDFDDNVQAAINRKQSYGMIEKLVVQLRERGFDSINFDLIYGLPLQTEATFIETTMKVIKLCPDTISLFGYAHMPEKIKNQRALAKYTIIEGVEKYKLFELSKNLLIEYGYELIGLDQFSLKKDDLYKAYEKKNISRTFMGYIKDASPANIGLGASAISSSGFGFIQNEKDVSDYINKVSRKSIPIVTGHTQDLSDKTIEKIIHQIMCHREIDISEFLLHYSKQNATRILSDLRKYTNDNLISFSNGNIKITSDGQAFLRNICMTFDPLFLN